MKTARISSVTCKVLIGAKIFGRNVVEKIEYTICMWDTACFP